MSSKLTTKKNTGSFNSLIQSTKFLLVDRVSTKTTTIIPSPPSPSTGTGSDGTDLNFIAGEEGTVTIQSGDGGNNISMWGSGDAGTAGSVSFTSGDGGDITSNSGTGDAGNSGRIVITAGSAGTASGAGTNGIDGTIFTRDNLFFSVNTNGTVDNSANANPILLTVSNVLSGLIMFTNNTVGTAARFPSSAELVQAFPNVQVGDIYECIAINTTSSIQNITIQTSDGTSFFGANAYLTGNGADNVCGVIALRFLNVSSGTEDVQGIILGINGF